jgi:hypothetical protein
MARARAKRRVTKEVLALAVRKHFNALPVNESDAIVHSLYKARTKGEFCVPRGSVMWNSGLGRRMG